MQQNCSKSAKPRILKMRILGLKKTFTFDSTKLKVL